MELVYEGVSKESRKVIEKALASILEPAPKSMESLMFAGQESGLPALTLKLSGWDLGLYNPRKNEWLWEQRCPGCGSGSRWVVNGEVRVLACGGCGRELAPPGYGIQEIVLMDTPKGDRFCLRGDAQALLQWNGMDPLGAAMEANALAHLLETLLDALGPLTW